MGICIPFANGAPAASGPPNWWDPTGAAAATFNQRLTDPRWNGATAVGFPDSGGSGTGEQALFRALHFTDAGQTSLYLQWWAKTNPTPDNANDRVLVGLKGPGVPVVVEAQVFPNSAPPADTGQFATRAPSAVRVYADNAQVTAPAWAALATTQTRVWTFPGQWALAMHIPLLAASPNSDGYDDTGIYLGAAADPFGLWTVVQTTQPTTVVPFQFPRGLPTFTGGFPDPSTWDQAHIGTGAACGTGVSLAVTDVGTTNPVPNEILYSTTTPHPTNTFFANPANTGPAIAAGQLTATFRLANWGSQPADWNAVADPHALWTAIPADPGTANPAPNDAALHCGFTWTIDDPTDFVNGTRRSHQCMLVELDGAGLTFINQSVYRNMDVGSASTFERVAELNTAGLASLGTPQRTLWLYLETTNMPATVDKPRTESASFTHALKTADARGNDADTDSASVLDHVVATLPTYRVHVYHETGETLDQDGTQRKLLAPQTSFGYVIRHEGPLYGWTPELHGPGLVKVAPNWYRLHVDDGGKVDVTTKVTAHEQPIEDPPAEPVDEADDRLRLILLLLALLALLALIWRWIRS